MDKQPAAIRLGKNPRNHKVVQALFGCVFQARQLRLRYLTQHHQVYYARTCLFYKHLIIFSDNSNSESNSLLSGLQNTPSVKYEDVLQATNNFSPANILGRGGYGVVYKGVWKHLEVAVKRIQHKKDNSIEVRYFIILITGFNP